MILWEDSLSLDYAYISNTELPIPDKSGPTQPGFPESAGEVRDFWTSWKCLKHKAKSITNMQ